MINASGQVAAHEGSMRQRTLLQAEGIAMNQRGRITWRDVAWSGPSSKWVEASGMDPIRLGEIMMSWPG